MNIRKRSITETSANLEYNPTNPLPQSMGNTDSPYFSTTAKIPSSTHSTSQVPLIVMNLVIIVTLLVILWNIVRRIQNWMKRNDPHLNPTRPVKPKALRRDSACPTVGNRELEQTIPDVLRKGGSDPHPLPVRTAPAESKGYSRTSTHYILRPLSPIHELPGEEQLT